ncbi:MAG: membrane protease subunit HflC, partial [Myxococcota bacterium]
MNRSNMIAVIAALVVVTLVVAFQSFFVVRVDRFAIVTQFGKPVRVLEEPGLYFKTPLIQDVTFLDKRVRGWDDQAADTKTLDSRQIDYTVYGRWRITDP